MDRRSLIKALPLGLISLLSGCSGHPLPPPRGTVIGRTVVGQREGRSVRIGSVNQSPRSNSDSPETTGAPIGFVLNDSTYEDVSEAYDDVRCYVSIRHEGYDGLRNAPATSDVIHYATDRTLFNAAQFGDFVVITTGLDNSLTGFHRIVRSGRVVRKPTQVSDTDADVASEYPGYIVLSHNFESGASRKRYPATRNVYSNVERGQTSTFGLQRESTPSGTHYLYLDALDPSRSWTIL